MKWCSVVNGADGIRSLVPSKCPKTKYEVSDTFVLVCRGGSLVFLSSRYKEEGGGKETHSSEAFTQELESLGEFPASP